MYAVRIAAKGHRLGMTTKSVNRFWLACDLAIVWYRNFWWCVPMRFSFETKRIAFQDTHAALHQNLNTCLCADFVALRRWNVRVWIAPASDNILHPLKKMAISNSKIYLLINHIKNSYIWIAWTGMCTGVPGNIVIGWLWFSVFGSS